MRKNEYESLEQFESQYIGEWGPSDGHWLGLDFVYSGVEYRLQTWSMYRKEAILPNGREVMFELHRKKQYIGPGENEYELLGEYADMSEVLESTVIQGRPFKEVIMDDATEIMGQD
jgi:hypothetical protein